MIPVTVLTGFLGSGKTTLLARLLQSPAFARTAVIINEFGEVGIDHDLVAASDESYVQLETGCICCMVRGDLEATLADLVAGRSEGSLPAFERIVIETSGLADPAPVLNAVMAEAGRGAGIALDGIVTTVDALTGIATLDSEPQSARQVAVADRIVVTKTDLADTSIDRLSARISGLNPRARILTAISGVIDPTLLLGGGLASNDVEGWLAASPDLASHPVASMAPHDASDHDTSDIVCFTIRRERALPALALTLLLEALADHYGPGLLRLKGLIRIAELPDRPAVVHGVQHVFHEPRWLDKWPSADISTRLVLIGRGLSSLWVESLLDALEAEIIEASGIADR